MSIHACMTTLGRIAFILLLLNCGSNSFGWANDIGQNQGVISLTDGGYVSGSLVDFDSSDRLKWNSPLFVAPLEFPLSAISTLTFPQHSKPHAAKGDSCFELAGGDLCFGSLLSLERDHAVIEVSEIGKVSVARSLLRRMYRQKGSTELIFLGPNGLAGWTTKGPKEGWLDEAGRLMSSKAGSRTQRDFNLPNKSRIEFELSWKSKPDFSLVLAASSDPKQTLNSYRFEVWEKAIIANRETSTAADVAELQPVEDGPGRVRLIAFIDQEKGQFLVYSSSGRKLAELDSGKGTPKPSGVIHLTNKGPNLLLERLSIGHWNGDVPQEVTQEKSRIHLSDGTIIYGDITSYEAGKNQFVVTADAAQSLEASRVEDIVFNSAADESTQLLRASFQSGQRISGHLVRVDQGRIWLKRPGIKESIAAPIASLSSLVVSDDSQSKSQSADDPSSADNASKPARMGRLESKELRLFGGLVSSDSNEATSSVNQNGIASCLIWKATLATVAVSLKRDASAKIIYNDPPTQPQVQSSEEQQRQRILAQRQQARANAGVVGGLANIFSGNGSVRTKKAIKNSKPLLHLRSGDTIPCDVKNIDEQGVTFSSTVSEATFIPHAKLKALELQSEAAPVQIAKQKRERLLMLPRMQRDSPPTQLIRSIDGDYLRGRLISMDDAQIQVEVRLETKLIPRDRVARIIWLHPDEIVNDGKKDSSSKPEEKAASPVAETSPSADLHGIRVQAQPSDGNRITFNAEKFEGTSLRGRSELLGSCLVDVNTVDQILIGSAIERAAAELAFHRWRLTPAADPLEGNPDAPSGGGEGEGMESPLVGKPAPDFKLETLDGKEFHLASRKNKVVILDFWASWCGPCLQVMPQVERVAKEFEGEGVELVGVNLEESADRVKVALRRLKLDLNVALDSDGRVAERYGASSIPQTVIIDRDGKVARLYVGASARFDDTLRTVLQELLKKTDEKSDQ